MPQRSRSLPQAPPAVDALALVCTLPAGAQHSRRVDMNTLLARATSIRGTPEGIVLLFADAGEIAQSLLDFVLAERICCAQFRYTLVFSAARVPVELHVSASQELVAPLEDLYLGLAREAGIHVEP